MNEIMNEQIASMGASKSRTISVILEKISFIALLISIFLLPIFFVPVTFISVQFGSSLLFATAVIISLVCFLVKSLIERSIVVPGSLLQSLGLFVAVPVGAILSALFAPPFALISRMEFLGYTFDESTIGFIVLAFVGMFLVSIFFRNRERIFYSYLALVVSSVISACIFFIRLVFGSKVLAFNVFNNITSTVMGSWSSFGIFFGIAAILSVLTLEMLRLHRPLKIVVSLALLASLFFIAVVNFLAIWIIVGVMALLTLVYKMYSPNNDVIMGVSEPSSKKSLFFGSPYALIVCLVSLIAIVTPLGGGIANKLHISNTEVRPGLQVTYDIFVRTIQKSPVFGSGPNTFATQWMSYKPADVNSTVFWNTDFAYGVGLLPTFFITTGLAGTLLWLFFFAVYLLLGWKALFSKESDTFARYLLISSFFISLYLWIMSLIYVPSIIIFILTFFFTGLFLACLSSVQQVFPTRTISFVGNPKVGFLSSLVLTVLFFCSLGLAYGLYQNSLSLWYFQKSLYSANTNGNLADAARYITSAEKTVPYDIYYRTESEIGLAFINQLLSQDLSKADIKAVSDTFVNDFSATVAAALNAKKIDSMNYLNWVDLGRAYAVGVPAQTKVPGAYEGARDAFLQAQKINPQNPAINLFLAQLEATNGNSAGAKTYANAAIAQKPNYVDAYFFLTQLEVGNKNIPGAIDSVTKALALQPNDPSIYFELGLLKYNQGDWNGAIEALEKANSLLAHYANAQYFLGLAYAQTGNMSSAIIQFEDLAKTNPDDASVAAILANLKAGKSPFANAKSTVNTKPEKGSTLPIKEKVQ